MTASCGQSTPPTVAENTVKAGEEPEIKVMFYAPETEKVIFYLKSLLDRRSKASSMSNAKRSFLSLGESLKESPCFYEFPVSTQNMFDFLCKKESSSSRFSLFQTIAVVFVFDFFYHSLKCAIKISCSICCTISTAHRCS